MTKRINEFFKQRANMRVLKQDALFKISASYIKTYDTVIELDWSEEE